MISQEERQIIIENFQDSLRLVRHLMDFSVEEFAEAIGVSQQTINDIETKKIKMSAVQYIAIAALTDHYFMNHENALPKLKSIIDSDGKNYYDEYETSFLCDSLLKRWFDDFINESRDENRITNEILWNLAKEYKIFLDAEVLKTKDAESFVKDLTIALKYYDNKIILPLRSIELLEIEKENCLDKIPPDLNQALQLVNQMQIDSILQIHGEESDPDFYDTILSVFNRFHNIYNLCLITENNELASEVLNLNDPFGNQEYNITAGFIDQEGFQFYNLLEQGVEVVPITEEEDSLSNIKSWPELEDKDENGNEEDETDFKGWNEV